MKNTVLFILCALVYSGLNGKIPTTYSVEFSRFVGEPGARIETSFGKSAIEVADVGFLDNIPEHTNQYRIYEVVVNSAQKRYENLRAGKISRESYDKFVSLFRVDTTLLSDAAIRNNFHIYVGIDKDVQKKYVVVDANNNHDFSDDSLYTFDLNDFRSSDSLRAASAFYIYNIPVEYFDGDKIIPASANASFRPLGSVTFIYNYNSEDDRYLSIIPATVGYMRANAVINDEKINIIGTNQMMIDVPFNNETTFVLWSDSVPARKTEHRVGDTVEIADRMLRLSKAGENTLYIDDLGYSPDSSRLGRYLPVLYSMEIEGDGSMVRLNDMFSDKYVFIDFWGSWCGPCVASIPKLKEFYESVRHRDDVVVVGIALDHAKDLIKLKSIIADKGVEWPNFWNNYADQQKSHAPTYKLKMNMFPTYMIIDKSGKIVYREISGDATSKAIEFFNEMISFED